GYHQWREGAKGVEDAAQVGIENGVPFFQRLGVQRPAKPADPCIVNQNVNTSKSFLYAAGHRFHGTPVGNVASNGLGFAAGGADLPCSMLQAGKRSPANNCGCSQVTQLQCNRSANSSTCTGHQSNFPV